MTINIIIIGTIVIVWIDVTIGTIVTISKIVIAGTDGLTLKFFLGFINFSNLHTIMVELNRIINHKINQDKDNKQHTTCKKN